jgi:hypothetical protein
MKRIWLAMVIAVAACGGHRYYTRPGATADDFYSDKAACMAQARSATTYQGNPFIAVQQESEITDLCLQGKGWRLTQPPQAPENVAAENSPAAPQGPVKVL